MSERRSETKIIRDILDICLNKKLINKTGLVYGANLNFKTIKPYLDTLLNVKAIEKVESYYRITSEGITLSQKLSALPIALGGSA